ncbi:MAG: ABC transporter permease [Anaerolineaceae bacterium]|nr:ABC transporter permease [Anaerolineaceae bacterium]MBN2676984.1 ABC transporter permease [Anaerolineaceae bacterium]
MNMPDLQITHIRPTQGWAALNLKDLWLYRELVYFLTWRDIKVRYKQAILGIAWAILQPLLTMIVFSIIFGGLAKLPSDGIPYPLFSYAAVLPWQLFSSALHRSSVSLVGNANLLTKIYFPRLIIPFSAVMASLVDFGIAFLVMIGLMLYYQVWPTLLILWIIPLTLLALLTALAVSLWLSALNVLYRDVQHMIPFLTQFWMYASPVAYSADLIPTGIWRIIYGLNPMAGVIQGFRWALLGTRPPDIMMGISIAIVLILLVTGLFYFRRMEKTFADRV